MITHLFKGSDNIARAGVLIDLAILIVLSIDVYLSYQNLTDGKAKLPMRRFSW